MPKKFHDRCSALKNKAASHEVHVIKNILAPYFYDDLKRLWELYICMYVGKNECYQEEKGCDEIIAFFLIIVLTLYVYIFLFECVKRPY